MSDYYPLLPWFGFALLGIWAGRRLYPGGMRCFALPDLAHVAPIRAELSWPSLTGDLPRPPACVAGTPHRPRRWLRLIYLPLHLQVCCTCGRFSVAWLVRGYGYWAR